MWNIYYLLTEKNQNLLAQIAETLLNIEESELFLWIEEEEMEIINQYNNQRTREE